jgi:hypothetical protein
LALWETNGRNVAPPWPKDDYTDTWAINTIASPLITAASARAGEMIGLETFLRHRVRALNSFPAVTVGFGRLNACSQARTVTKTLIRE